MQIKIIYHLDYEIAGQVERVTTLRNTGKGSWVVSWGLVNQAAYTEEGLTDSDVNELLDGIQKRVKLGFKCDITVSSEEA